jgi:hypothetical protein
MKFFPLVKWNMHIKKKRQHVLRLEKKELLNTYTQLN